jgi:hypothetical protein
MAQDYGTPIAPPPADEIPPMAPAPKKSNRTLWIVLAVVVILLCCCCLVAVGVYLYQNGDQIMNSINGFISNPFWMPV